MPRKQKNKRGGSSALAPSEFSGGSGCPLAANPPPAGMAGGSGAADYAISVYGNTDGQRAMDGSNVIATNNPNAPIVPPTGTTGGNRGGRGVITDVAVPALLLYANNTFKRNKYMKRARKSKKNRSSRKSRRRRR